MQTALVMQGAGSRGEGAQGAHGWSPTHKEPVHEASSLIDVTD